ncbi:MAG: LamG domain-containing protein [Puniceicoccales bacterium]|jgi:hypothetical protein|nr:LamG domain-containing protein [Puniceicoccales bacterium]
MNKLPLATVLLLGAASLMQGATLVAWYDFENSGTDASGNNRNLSGTGSGVAYGSATINGDTLKTVTFSGNSTTGNAVGTSYLSLASGNMGITNESFSVSFWANSSGAGAWRDLVSFCDSASNGFKFETKADAENNPITIYSTGVTFTPAVPNDLSSRNAWHHYALTVDSLMMSFYIDNFLVASATIDSGTQSGLITTFLVGRRYNGGTGWNGSIADLQVYEGALTAVELNEIYLNHTPIPEPSTYIWAGVGLGALILIRRRLTK